MPFIERSLCTEMGVARFDAEHLRLAAMINLFHEALQSGECEGTLKAVLTRLIDYSALHFAAEEQAMLRYAYPGYQAHAEEHNLLMNAVRAFKEQFDLSFANRSAATIQFAEFFRTWFVQHLTSYDRELGEFLNKTGANLELCS